MREVPGQEPAHPLRCHRDARRLGRRRAQQAGVCRHPDAAAHRALERPRRRRQGALPLARVLHLDRAGPRWRLPAVCTARLPALLAPHLRDAAPGAARADGRLRAPRQRARRLRPRPHLRHDRGHGRRHRSPRLAASARRQPPDAAAAAAARLHERRPARRPPVRLRPRGGPRQGLDQRPRACPRRRAADPPPAARPGVRLRLQQRVVGARRDCSQGGRADAPVRRGDPAAAHPDHQQAGGGPEQVAP
mmetsp:Transcript_43977/g.121812  ORF Transcript_43977/g.121812 Transcript_43977/m.121812 type:complete len:248 (+) Transcript_43977:534-1277(+)